MSDVRFGPFRFDPARRLLWRGDGLVRLAPKALDLLAVLVERPGQVVTKSALLERVWPDTFVGEANLSVHVAALRKALGRRDDRGGFVETVPKRGYRFVAPVEVAAEPGFASLAVLPFERLGGGGEEDRDLGLALAEALIARLGRVEGLVVRPFGCVVRLAGMPPVEAARRLGVEAVVEGRFQTRDARLRLSVDLVPAAGASTSWSGTFDAALDDPFALQDSLAHRVAAALGGELSGPAPPIDTGDAEARLAHARGRWFWSRLSGTSLAQAHAAFERATTLDPGFAAPWAGLADLHVVLGFSGLVPPHDAWRAAESAAGRALAADPALAEPRVCRGYVRLFRDWDWNGAQAELDRAVAGVPASGAAHQWLGLFLLLRGRPSEAAPHMLRARELDPVSLIAQTLVGLQAYVEGDAARAAEEHRRSVEMDPHQFLGHWGLGLALSDLGEAEAAVAEHRIALERAEGHGFLEAVLARSLALAGRTDEARERLDRIAAAGGSAYQRATVHLALGEDRAALDRLGEAVAARDPWVSWIGSDPMLEPLRREPGFRLLEARVMQPADPA